MRENDLLDLYYRNLTLVLKQSEVDDEFVKSFQTVFEGCERKFYQKNIVETKHFDEEWIRTMEAFFPSIDRIIRNPKLTIRYDEDVVAIEKAKKINSASIRHLASHTQLIREVKDSQVTPKKILTSTPEEEIVTYENRFIMTLIERLYLFVNNRYQIIKDNVESFQKDHLNYVANLDIQGTKVDISFDVKIKKDLENASINKHNYDLLARVDRLNTLIGGYKNSPFMRQMGKARKVAPPIMKTNVILKNADFKNAYMLWLFLDRYNSLAFDVSVRERPIHLSRAFDQDLNRLAMVGYSMMLENMKRRNEFDVKLEDVESIIKKSTKVAKIHPDDVVKRPDAIVLGDLTINEYYLEQNRKISEKTLRDYRNDKMTEPQVLKKAVKDTISITNALFQSIFNLEEETDYFQKMTTSTNPRKDYEEAVYKRRLATIIREQKEMDYKQALKLERSLLQAMEKANSTLIKEEAARQRLDNYEKYRKQIENELKKLHKTQERIKRDLDILEGKYVDIASNKTVYQQEVEETKKRIDEGKKEIVAKEREAGKKEISELRKAHNAYMKKVQADNAKALNEAKIAYEARKELMKQKIKEALQKAKEEEKVKQKELAEKEKARLKELALQEKAKMKLIKEKAKADLLELEKDEARVLEEIANGTYVEKTVTKTKTVIVETPQRLEIDALVQQLANRIVENVVVTMDSDELKENISVIEPIIETPKKKPRVKKTEVVEEVAVKVETAPVDISPVIAYIEGSEELDVEDK